MTIAVWPADTIARRFVIAEVLSIAGTLVLVSLFGLFGGVFSRESLDRTGLLNEASDLLRVIEAAPAPVRGELARAASGEAFRVNWYAVSSDASESLNKMRRHDRESAIDQLFGGSARQLATYEPKDRESLPPQLRQSASAKPYVLAVKLNDASWLAFTVEKRVWGLPQSYRWIIRLLFAALSIAVVSTITARQFAKPVKRLAEAVHRFGVSPSSVPMPETGPRELRQVTRTFNLMQAQIKRFVSYRTTMLAAISHDLRTPLTRIRLRGEYIEDPEQQARLFQEVDEMQAMVDGALAFFRDDTVTEQITSLDLPQLLLTLVNDYDDQHVKLRYRGPTHARYTGRPIALKRAFTNLIDNSIKYAAAPEIELSCGVDAFVILISDRGPGIPADDLDTVFRPYYRLEKSRNRMTGGVGLGLTVVQAIVQGHGGEVSLANRPGGGLEARVTLPIGTTSEQSP